MTDDKSQSEPKHHSVNAGGANWSVDVPQPSVTHLVHIGTFENEESSTLKLLRVGTETFSFYNSVFFVVGGTRYEITVDVDEGGKEE